MSNDRSRRGPGSGSRGPSRPWKPRRDRPETSRPENPRAGTPRPESPRPESPNPDATGQAGAINRSRPIYDNVPNRGRPRRGRPYPANGAAASRQSQSQAQAPSQPPPLPSNPREAALRILHAVDTRSAFGDRMLDGAHQSVGRTEISAEDRIKDEALLHELVKGSLRWRGRLDHALDRLIHVGFDRLQPWIKNILRLGAYQILFLDRIPPHAAVDESVKLAHKYGHPGSAGLVNSVLRRLVDEKPTIAPPMGDDPESLAVWGSHPLWIVERWCDRFGAIATRDLMLANNRAVRTGLRVNALKGTREQLIERLTAEGVTAVPATLAPDVVWLETPRGPGGLKAFKEGYCTAQDESEALVARLVAPRPHERILDVCAAPGGKSTHLAALMGDEGEVWAMERSPERMPSLEQNIARLGTHCIHAVQGDGRTYPFPMPFDRILVDAPCSGLGVLGRRSDARWRKGPEVLREMPPIQLELLSSAGRRARPGGVLVYSVCSFETEETTDVVERFLQQNPSFVIESASGLLPSPVVDHNGFMYTLPHIHGCDGAFAVRFRQT